MKIDGRCLCGAITWQAEVDPSGVTACHCKDCQVSSGAPYRVSVMAQSYELTGTPSIYIKTAASGRKRAQAFCPTCGTSLYSSQGDPTEEKTYNIRIGNAHQRADLKPTLSKWVSSKLPWTDDVCNLEEKQEQ